MTATSKVRYGEPTGVTSQHRAWSEERKRRDSNPRYLSVRSLSRRVH
jgi:hypothetical protein